MPIRSTLRVLPLPFLAAALLCCGALWGRKAVLKSWTGHGGPVYGVAMSPDGKTAFSASFDRNIKIWTVESGKDFATLQGHEDGVRSVAVSPDGKTVVSGSGDRNLRVWDAVSGGEKEVWSGHEDGVVAVVFSPDGKLVLSGSRDGLIKIWDAAGNGEAKATWKGHTADVTALAFAPDGETVLSASVDKTVRLWNVGQGKELARLEGHTDPVMAVAFCADGKIAVSAGEDKTVRFWDMDARRQLGSVEAHKAEVRALACSPDGRTAISGGFDKTLHLWDMSSRRLITELEGNGQYIYSVAFAPNGRSALLGAGDEVLVLDLAEALKQAAKPKSRPELGIQPEFVGTVTPGILDGGEKGTLKVTVLNSGELEAGDVVLQLEDPGVEGVTLAPTFKVGRVKGGKSVTVDVPVEAAKDVRTGPIRVSISAKEANGFDAEAVTIDFKTRTFQEPKLELAGVALAGGARWVEVGLPTRITVKVRNAGGVARGVVARLSIADKAVSATGSTAAKLEVIEPGKTKEAEFTFAVGEKFTGRKVPVSLALVEARPQYSVDAADLGLSLAEGRGTAAAAPEGEEPAPVQEEPPPPPRKKKKAAPPPPPPEEAAPAPEPELPRPRKRPVAEPAPEAPSGASEDLDWSSVLDPEKRPGKRKAPKPPASNDK